jgi:hypothetical protein
VLDEVLVQKGTEHVDVPRRELGEPVEGKLLVACGLAVFAHAGHRRSRRPALSITWHVIEILEEAGR